MNRRHAVGLAALVTAVTAAVVGNVYYTTPVSPTTTGVEQSHVFREVEKGEALQYQEKKQQENHLPNEYDIQKNVVVVLSEIGGCNGVITNTQGYVLTNAHCVEGRKDVEVYGSNFERKYTASVVAVSKDSDVALLQLHNFTGLEVNTLRLYSRRKLPQGESIMVHSYRLDLEEVTPSSEVLTARVVCDSALPWEQEIDQPVYRGQSGSPAFDREGYFVGLVKATPLDTATRPEKGASIFCPGTEALLVSAGGIVRDLPQYDLFAEEKVR